MPKLDIVIPVYNEERALPIAVERLRAHLEGWPEDWRIVIADNASTDSTEAVGRRLDAEGQVAYVRIPTKGRGYALRHAWGKSDADVLAYMDVDLSTGLEALRQLVDAVVSGGYDLATGSRNMKESQVVRSAKRRVLTWVYNHLLRVVLRIRFSDAQCGFKAISRESARALLPLVEDNNWFFDTELLVIADKAGYRIKDIPVIWLEDADSRVNIAPTVAEDLRGVWRLLRKRPWEAARESRTGK